MKTEHMQLDFGTGRWLGSMELAYLIKKGSTMLVALMAIILGVACSGQPEPLLGASEEDRIL